LKWFNIFALSLVLFACSHHEMAPPACRVAPQAVSDIAGEAACVIKLNAKLLVLQRSSGKYDLPFHPNDSALPAQCAAHQGAWQETGFNVEVGEKLTTQRNGVSLFACALNAGFDGTEKSIAPPPWRPKNVEEMTFIYPFDIDLHQWHEPDQFIAVRDAFILYPENNLGTEETEETEEIDAINTSD
jgi:hypothetical protein